MARFGHVTRLAMVCALSACMGALFLASPPTLAQGKAKEQASTPIAQGAKKAHRLVLQVNTSEPATMNLALNNATNVEQYYKDLGETVEIEVVTFGPGLHMLRSDTSPVKERIAVMSLETPNMTFAACGNTQANQAKAENKPVTLINEAKVTPSGVVRLMELQKQGYAYIKP